MPAYYNEFDPYAAQWLRNLIAAGHIAPGDVDERSILEVKADDLRSYDQCHFFAGIGGWSHALRLAGWPDDRPVWTGSCPCQPFSAAGKQRGSDDERHLWPAFFDLIRECGPGSVFGEQVAGAAALAWLDHVCADLEGAGYAAAAAALPACCVGAHHRRERLFWVAHADGWDASAERQQRSGQQRQQQENGFPGALADFESRGRRQRGSHASRGDEGTWPEGAGLRFADDGGGGLGHSERALHRCEGEAADHVGAQGDGPADRPSRHGDSLDAWGEVEWLQCSDGKARPTQPGLFPLAHGIPNRVGRLRAYGNAIVPQVAAVFVMANV
jgi:DNA (cytosine-5)-methyltransferase 1